MAKCVICGSEASMLSQKKLMDGIICGNCANKIPHVLHGTLGLYDRNDISQIIHYEEQMKQKGFSATSSYGKLHLDEMNGLIAICDKVDSDGIPVGQASIFDLTYLDSIGLYPIDPRQSRKDVVCDVEYSCVYRFPKMKFKLTVKQGVKCDFKQINKGQATWSEPGELSMFRNMLDQTIRTSVKKEMSERDPVATPYDVDLLKARACLHVYEGCPKSLLDKQYLNMRKMYENGEYSDEDRKVYIDLLTKYYQMLD